MPTITSAPGMSSSSFSPSTKKWWCVGGVGVEIGLRAVDRDLAQQADLGELVQRVVDGRERHRHLGAARLLVEHLGGEVAVALAEQDPAERHALAGRPQPTWRSIALTSCQGQPVSLRARPRRHRRQARQQRPWYASGSSVRLKDHASGTIGGKLVARATYTPCASVRCNCFATARMRRIVTGIWNRRLCAAAGASLPAWPGMLRIRYGNSAQPRRAETDAPMDRPASQFRLRRPAGLRARRTVRPGQRAIAAAADADVRPHHRDLRDRAASTARAWSAPNSTSSRTSGSSPATSRAIR